MKTYLITQRIRDGEREYENHFVCAGDTEHEVVKKYDEPKDNCGLDELNGETCTDIINVQEITVEQEAMLRKLHIT